MNNNDLNNSNPLESVTIGKVKQNKYSFIIVVFLFLVFVGIIYFLPELNVLYEKYILKKVDYSDNVVVTNNTVSKKEEEIDYFSFEENKELTVDNIVFSSIKFENDTLTFNALNKNSKAIDLNKTPLFFEFFENKNVVKRVAIEGNISSNSVKSFSFNLPLVSADSFNISKYNDGEYSIFEAEENENGISKVTCLNGKETLTYTFKNGNLTNITDIVVVDLENETEYSYYNLLAGNFENGKIRGAVANIKNENDQVLYTMEIDYNMLSTPVENSYYFDKNEDISKVVFLMDARLFNCN